MIFRAFRKVRPGDGGLRSARVSEVAGGAACLLAKAGERH